MSRASPQISVSAAPHGLTVSSFEIFGGGEARVEVARVVALAVARSEGPRPRRHDRRTVPEGSAGRGAPTAAAQPERRHRHRARPPPLRRSPRPATPRPGSSRPRRRGPRPCSDGRRAPELVSAPLPLAPVVLVDVGAGGAAPSVGRRGRARVVPDVAPPRCCRHRSSSWRSRRPRSPATIPTRRRARRRCPRSAPRPSPLRSVAVPFPGAARVPPLAAMPRAAMSPAATSPVVVGRGAARSSTYRAERRRSRARRRCRSASPRRQPSRTVVAHAPPREYVQPVGAGRGTEVRPVLAVRADEARLVRRVAHAVELAHRRALAAEAVGHRVRARELERRR